MKYKICVIVCWFGNLPDYIEIWNKSCAENSDYTFLFFTDVKPKKKLAKNVKVIPFTINEFRERAQRLTKNKISLKRAYRVCDFRPCYGDIFREEIKEYDFWGYCDIDLVFGNLNRFITDAILDEYDAIFNGGHFSILRNNELMNKLYLRDGSAFDFNTVSTHDAIFAFDEITGIQSIAMNNGIRAKYLIPYIETEIRFKQLRSRLDISNPDCQAFFWESGELFRVKTDGNDMFYQNYSYIHLQKRKLSIVKKNGIIEHSFWITPTGFEKKANIGKPQIEEIMEKNPYEGDDELRRQNRKYKVGKIITILKRNPFQIYVRLVQEKVGINRNQGTLEEQVWIKY